jgi:anti-sigma factor RsiW
VTCRELADFINGYLERELAPDIQQAFERHLQRCPNCRRYLSIYKASVILGRQAFEADDSAAGDAGVPDELIQAILQSRKS